MNAPFSRERWQQLPIVAILRGLPIEHLASVVEAVRDGGLTNLEITMNTPDAAEQIRLASQLAGTSVNVGAGTVTDLRQLDLAMAAGAGFIVTPTLSLPVLERCVHWGVPIFPGAFTPSEVVRVWELGATMVKVFPADTVGPAHIQSLKASMPALRLMPTGGIDLLTLKAYAEAGADAFGVGSPLLRPERIAARDWLWLRNQSRAFAEAYRVSRQAATAGTDAGASGPP